MAKLIFEMSRPGRTAYSLPPCDTATDLRDRKTAGQTDLTAKVRRGCGLQPDTRAVQKKKGC